MGRLCTFVCDLMGTAFCWLLAGGGTVVALWAHCGACPALWLPNHMCDCAGLKAEVERGLEHSLHACFGLWQLLQAAGQEAAHEAGLAGDASPGLQAPQHCMHDHMEAAPLHHTYAARLDNNSDGMNYFQISVS